MEDKTIRILIVIMLLLNVISLAIQVTRQFIM